MALLEDERLDDWHRLGEELVEQIVPGGDHDEERPSRLEIEQDPARPLTLERRGRATAEALARP